MSAFLIKKHFKIKRGINSIMADDLFDFGFTLVDEDELDAVQTAAQLLVLAFHEETNKNLTTVQCNTTIVIEPKGKPRKEFIKC